MSKIGQNKKREQGRQNGACADRQPVRNGPDGNLRPEHQTTGGNRQEDTDGQTDPMFQKRSPL